MRKKFTQLLFLMMVTLSTINLYAEAHDVEKNSKELNPETHDYDKYNGDEINQVCAGCHGEFGMGGSEGKYPRLAGLPVQYTIQEIVRFRERKRPNISMVEHVEERQLSNEDVLDISIFLNKIVLATHLPKVDENAPGFNAYARLKEAEMIIQIGIAEGDVKAGEKLYRKECKSCHGKKGEGDQKDGTPMLAGQYTKYLWRQIKLYINRERTHDEDDPEEEFLKSFSHQQLQDIFAYISTLDD